MKISFPDRQESLAAKFISFLKRRFFFLPVISFSLFFSAGSFGQSQDQVTIMCYNLLNYPAGSPFTTDTTTRNPFYRITVAAANPDILVVEEMNSQAGLTGFLNNVMNASSTTYAAGTFIDGPDTDNGIFYKTAKFHFVSNTRIKTDLRDINEFKLVHILSGDTCRIYAVHLKASSTGADEAQRAVEVDSLRNVTNVLPPGSNFIVCGDFNFYGSTSTAYQKLLQINPTDEGYFIDPISMTGTWNNGSYAIHHTQSTRVTTFLNDGGSTGGLDDRFDLILYSKAISLAGGMTYVANSEIAYGNDGNHYNDSINKQPNTAVSVTVANALYNSSDHLPVIANFKFDYGAVPQPDFGVLLLLSPSSPICSNANQLLQVQVKNFGSSTTDFSGSNLQVILQVTNPSSVVQTFTKTITSGTLAAGAVMNVSFDSTYNMTSAGNYTFNAHTVITNDANSSNNSMPAAVVTVNAYPSATVTPPGPLSICSGSSFTLTSSNGSTYLWSTGATTQSLSVSDAGNYSVMVTNANGCSSTSSPVVVSVINSQASGTVFLEPIDSVPVAAGGSMSITSYEASNGFVNDNLTMSGNSDVRNTTSSFGYSGASGSGNVFFTTNTSGARNFIIADINTSGLSNLQLSFGIAKSLVNANGSDMIVSVSSDGVNYTNLAYPPLPTGSGTTAPWYYRTASGSIPAVPNLRIQFKHDSVSGNYRIDDILLTYSGIVPVITPGGPTTFCQGDSVMLTSTAGTTYLWSNGATTQSIKVYSAGSYTVTVDCLTSLPVSVTVNSYTINSSAGSNGNINPSGASTNCGNNRTYTITPNACYHIADVLIDGVSNAGAIAAGTYTFTGVSANHTISAAFAINKDTITASTGANGSITPGGATVVNCGSNLSYSIVPNACYHIANVWVDGVSNAGAVTTGTYSFSNIASNHTISATFEMNQFTINSSAGANGSIAPNGSTVVNCGNNLSFMITPDSCNQLQDVLIDGVSNAGATAAGTFTFNNVTANHTISATFTAQPCSVILSLKLFFEGFYAGNGQMIAVLYNDGLSNDPTACDSITVELHDDVALDSVVASAYVLLHSDGTVEIPFPESVIDRSCYIVIHHHNSLEAWSKEAILFNSHMVYFDFTHP